MTINAIPSHKVASTSTRSHLATSANPNSKPRRTLRIHDLPFDIIILIARLLLPYDLLSLSSTCSSIRPIFSDKSIWLHIAELISRSKPFPFSIGRAAKLPIVEVQRACLRSQRVAAKSAYEEIPTHPKPRKLVVSSKTPIEYFTFLPGSKHILVFDAVATLSCWTIDGVKLAEMAMERGSLLTRWKPRDEGEVPDMPVDTRAIDIMLDEPKLGRTGRRVCQVLTLTYTDSSASFTNINRFSIPPVYDLYSALAHGDLNGMLVHINRSLIGIYLVDSKSDKAICFQTDISTNCQPQALLSAHHMVLYWESHSRGAYIRSYRMTTLRRLLNERGVPQDDVRLYTPIRLEPDQSRVIPFATKTASTFHRLRPGSRDNLDAGMTEDVLNGNANGMPGGGFDPDIEELGAGFAGMNINGDMEIIEEVGVENMDNPAIVFEEGVISWDLSPIIIPKWTSLREDLTRHRTRSIMSFSIPLNGIFNMDPHMVELDGWDIPQGDLNGNANGDVEHMANGAPHAEADFPPGFQPHHHQEPQIGHNAPLPDDDDVWDADVVAIHAEELLATTHQQNGNNHEGFALAQAHPHVHAHAHEHAALPAQPDNINVIPAGGGAVPVVLPIGGGGHLQLDINDFDFFGRRATISHHYFDFESHPLELHRTLIAEVILREPPRIVTENGQDRTFSASPIMGVGGRCALWVQQNVPAPSSGVVDESERQSLSDASSSRRGKQNLYVRLATFPSYEADRDGRVAYHEDLDITGGQVSTVLLPSEIELEKAIMFDLDDVRGFVGVVTMEGSDTILWLADFS